MVKAKQTRRDAFEPLAVEYLGLADRTPRDSDSPGTRPRTGGVNRTLGSQCGLVDTLIESWVWTSSPAEQYVPTYLVGTVYPTVRR